jgi:hypothetical protein
VVHHLHGNPALAHGVDMIELDVLRPPGDFADAGNWRSAAAGPDQGSGPLLVAHDWADARRADTALLSEWQVYRLLESGQTTGPLVLLP